jgi:adenine-specific DNA-methyltransferase
MSYFVEQNHTVCDFSSSDSWVILSPIEQSIKRKIEAVGTPLKDWDIQINYGIKTGYNDAFIISTAKRDEILSNCVDADERKRTEDLIRPILRGRDIKRYGYEWANLYLIATFPSKHYEIEKYPAVKKYLLSFAYDQLIEMGYQWVANDYLEDYCQQKLSQTGKFVMINGQRITFGSTPEKARKKTCNKWFETQDSISYWEDFRKPKIVWGNLNLRASYALLDNSYYINAPSPMIVPANEYLLAILNSKLADYYIRRQGVTRNGGYFEYKPMFIGRLPVPEMKISTIPFWKSCVDSIDENSIDKAVYSLYGISEEEVKYVEMKSK